MSHDPRLPTMFEAIPCRCDAHSPTVPPSGKEIDLHCARIRAEHALDALDGDRLERREWLHAISVRAAESALRLQLPPKAIEDPLRLLLAGFDDQAQQLASSG
jgi:hypothetical protein